MPQVRAKAPSVTDALRAYESMTPEEQSRRYRGLLKSHKQLEARVREGERAAQWWKDRTCTLDDRSRELAALLKAALDEKRALMEMVEILEREVSWLGGQVGVGGEDASTNSDALLQLEERAMGFAEEGWALEKRRGREKKKAKEKRNSRRAEGVGALTQTDVPDESEKALAIKELVQTLQTAIAPAKDTTCECESAKALKTMFSPDEGAIAEKEDPLGAMLSRRKEKRESRSRSGSLEERGNTPTGVDQISLASTANPVSSTNGTNRDSRVESRASGTSSGTALQVMIEAPPQPEVFSKARKERKQALKMKVKATREMVNGLRRENGVLEGLLGEEPGR